MIPVFLVLLQGVGILAEMDRKPNVIFIMADDLGYHDLACYGQTIFPTPHTDSLAQEGMLFTDAHSPSAICSPTRYAVMTGTDPFRSYHTTHVLFNGESLVIGRDQTTVASLMKKAGYATGIVGKWHLGLGDKLPRDINHPGRGPNDLGFDFSFLVADGHNMFPKYYLRNGEAVGGLNPAFDSRVEVLDRLGYKLLQRVPVGTWEDRRPEEEIGARLAEEVDRFIQDNWKKPFFLYYPTCSIHFPIVSDPYFQGKSGIGPHGDFVMEFDWAVGRVMKILDRFGLAEDTLLIVTSDNGGYGPVAGTEHRPTDPWNGHKESVFEGGHRVPFIARWPGHIEAGSTSASTISLVDLMATLASITGQTLDNRAALDSFSFLPALTASEANPLTRPFLVSGNRGIKQLAFRQGPWKLIMNPERGESQLFNLDLDPLEKSDLSRIWPKQKLGLEKRLTSYIEAGSSRPGARGTATSVKEIFDQREKRNQKILELSNSLKP